MLKCTACSFHKQSCRGFIETNYTSGRGNKPSDVMVVFDSLFISDLQSEQIVSDSKYNAVFNKYMSKIGLSLDDVYVTTFIKCYLSDKKKKPTKPMKQKCFELYLRKEIEEVKPKVIFVIGKMSTQWFIQDMLATTPLKQVVGKSFYNAAFNCQVVPVYDMYYLANFSSQAVQTKQTDKAFALAQTFLTSDVQRKQHKVEYSYNLEDLETFGDLVAIDLETTGLNCRKDKIVTVSITDIRDPNSKTVSLDIEAFGGICPCECQSGKVENQDKLDKLAKCKTEAQRKRLDKLPDEVECPTCGGSGKLIRPKKNSFYDTVFPVLSRILPHKRIVAHNASFDLQFLLASGIDIVDNLVSDTRLMQFLINPAGVTSLGFLIQLYYGISYKEEIDRACILKMPMEDRRYYCAEDTYYTARLFKELYAKLKGLNRLVSNQVLTNAMKVQAADLEYRGIMADPNKIYEIIDFYTVEKERLETKFKKRFNLDDDFNLNSSKQLGKLLYEDLGLPVSVKTASDNPACNEEAIMKLASSRPALKTLIEYRTVKGHIEKLRHYLKAIESDGRIHGSFNLFSPDSSRMMMSKPNLQNCPRQSRLKEVFVARTGYTYLYFDFNSLEFRVWADLSGDTNAIKFINEGKDIHAYIAAHFYKKPYEYFLNKKDPEAAEYRTRVKSVNFGSMYGRTPYGIVQEHGGTEEEAEEIQRFFFSLCRQGYFWLKQIETNVFKDKGIKTPFGTPRIFNDIELADDKERVKISREAKGFIVQSWAIELVYLSLYKIWKKIRELKLDAYFVHFIYDGLIIECRDDQVEKTKEVILKEGQNPYPKLKVPLTVDLKTGKSWDEVA